MKLYLAMCMISWRAAATAAAVAAVQTALGDIMSSELIMHLFAKPRLKGKFGQKVTLIFCRACDADTDGVCLNFVRSTDFEIFRNLKVET